MISYLTRFYSLIFGSAIFRYIAYPCIAISLVVGFVALLWAIIEKRA